MCSPFPFVPHEVVKLPVETIKDLERDLARPMPGTAACAHELGAAPSSLLTKAKARLSGSVGAPMDEVMEDGMASYLAANGYPADFTV